MLTGFPLEPSQESKTKEDVDLAGLSELLLPLNPPNSWIPVSSELCPNNNLPLVTPALSDVVEDINQLVSITMPTMESVHQPLTLIPPEALDKVELAYQVAPKTLSPSEDTTSSPESLLSNLLVTLDPLLLPLMPEDGLLIPVVSSPTVELPSITPSYLLDIPQTIG